MSATTTVQGTEHRTYPRRRLPPGYALVRVRRPGQRRFMLDGHAYDLSRSGVRFELDQPLNLGEQIDLQLQLPDGNGGHAIRATAVCVRRHDPDELGPIRVGCRFTDLPKPADRRILDQYLG